MSVPVLKSAQLVWQTILGAEEDRLKAEREFGAVLASRIRSASEGEPHGADLGLVRQTGQSLAARVKNRELRFIFEVVNVAQPSAIALPGGYVFVSTALLQLCQRNLDEIAFVLGHEMAHVIRGHASDRFLRESVIEVLAGRLRVSTPIGGLAKQAAIRLLSSTYSQDCEFEADELGIRLAHAAGFNPLGSLRLLGRLEKLHGDKSFPGQYFSSHPTPAQRMTRISDILKKNKLLPPRSAQSAG